MDAKEIETLADSEIEAARAQRAWDLQWKMENARMRRRGLRVSVLSVDGMWISYAPIGNLVVDGICYGTTKSADVRPAGGFMMGFKWDYDEFREKMIGVDCICPEAYVWKAGTPYIGERQYD